jgi:hypothetical protein
MPPAMVRIYPHLTSNCTIRRLRISVPLVEALLDNQRYFLPSDLAEPRGDELRPLYRPRLGHQPGSTPPMVVEVEALPAPAMPACPVPRPEEMTNER